MALCDVMFVIFLSSLLHLFITLEKKELIKYFVVQVKDGIFILFKVA